jgi:hypothetical protein
LIQYDYYHKPIKQAINEAGTASPPNMGDLISSLLFQPPTPTYLHPSRHFWLTTELGSRIPAFYIERPSALVTVLFSHGNAEDVREFLFSSFAS